jgi:putative solute:sodium symporter small subunit
MTPHIFPDFSQSFPDLSQAARAIERRYGVSGLKRGMLVLLTGWIVYFIVVNMFVRSLNKVTVPVLDMPLGIFLAMQGALVIFVVALVFMAKWRATRTARVRLRSRRAGH